VEISWYFCGIRELREKEYCFSWKLSRFLFSFEVLREIEKRVSQILFGFLFRGSEP
jgi:hypothetical protein